MSENKFLELSKKALQRVSNNAKTAAALFEIMRILSDDPLIMDINDWKTIIQVIEEKRKTAKVKAGSATKKRSGSNQEISTLQEILQEVEGEWDDTYGQDNDSYHYQEQESVIDSIPPTLRSPGTPLPEPPTRRDGRGQPPLPPSNNNEQPTVRLPGRFNSYRTSTNMPLQKDGLRPSIRREFEVPLMEEIFMEAEDETNDRGFSSEYNDTREFMVKPSKKRWQDSDDGGKTPDQPIAPPGVRGGGDKVGLKRIFDKNIKDIFQKLGRSMPRQKIIEKLWDLFTQEAKIHPDGHFHKKPQQAYSFLFQQIQDHY